MNNRIEILIKNLRLSPHPEGGYYREVFRSEANVLRKENGSERQAITAIYFLLTKGQYSRWHSVHSDEIWSHIEGYPIELSCFDEKQNSINRFRLGTYDFETEPIRVISRGLWQAAKPLGEYSLVGCYVGPGFDFKDFRFAAEYPEISAAIKTHGTYFAELL
ncbi:MAG: cupin domain-containing protein [Desulfobacterales bacterium]|nr:cupin domain-containing protein [Desulfobacterales bacterium]MBF0396642.1 cupin domain-containing protein [Desulfobacterales bacterium]